MFKNAIITIVLLFVFEIGNSQKPIESTDQFTIKGLVDHPVTILFSDLQNEKLTEIGNLKITNHLGEFKREYKNIKGVPMLTILKNVNITVPSPKLLSEYYFVLRASDGYSAVISWNELFNTETGNSFFIVIEADGKNQKDSADKILFISNKDYKTGRRHIKGLESIEVKRN